MEHTSNVAFVNALPNLRSPRQAKKKKKIHRQKTESYIGKKVNHLGAVSQSTITTTITTVGLLSSKETCFLVFT